MSNATERTVATERRMYLVGFVNKPQKPRDRTVAWRDYYVIASSKEEAVEVLRREMPMAFVEADKVQVFETDSPVAALGKSGRTARSDSRAPTESGNSPR